MIMRKKNNIAERETTIWTNTLTTVYQEYHAQNRTHFTLCVSANRSMMKISFQITTPHIWATIQLFRTLRDMFQFKKETPDDRTSFLDNCIQKWN